MADFDYAIEVVDEATGQTRLIPLDHESEEGRELLETARQSGQRLIQLDGNAQRALGREQYIQEAQGYIEQNVPFAPVFGAAVGAADELTLGIPSALLDQRRQLVTEALRRQEAGANIGGRIFGAVAPAFVTGGETLAARGGLTGVARFLPGGFAQAVGNTAERAFLSRLINRGVSQGMARSLAFAGGAAADGAVGGLTSAITNSNISGTPLDGEQVLADVGLGAALGLGVGGVMGTMRGLSRLGRGSTRLAAEQVQQMQDAGLGPTYIRNPQLEEAGGPIANVVTHPVARRLAGLTADSNEPALRRIMADPQTAMDNAGYIDQVRRAARANEEAINGLEVHANTLRDSVRRQGALLNDLDGVFTPEVNGARLAMRDMTRSLRDLSASGALSGTDRRLLTTVADLLDQPGASGAEVAIALDNTLQRIRNEGMVAAAVDPAVRGHLETIVAQIRGVDGTGGILGRLSPGAANVARVNHLLDTADAAKADALKYFGQDMDRFQNFAVNQGNMRAATGQSSYTLQNDTLRHLNQYYQDMEKLMALVPGSEGAVEAARRAGTEITEAMRRSQLVSDMADLSAKESQAAGFMAALGLGGTTAGIAVGALVGGPLGAVLGGATGLLMAGATHPVGAIRRLGGITRSANRSRQRVQDGLRNIRSMLQNGRRMKRLHGGARQIPRVVLALKSPSERKEQYNTLLSQLRELASNPEQLMEAVEFATGPVGVEISPQMGDAMAMTLVSGVQYLVANLPPSSSASLFGDDDEEPSLVEMDAFIRRWEAVNDPLSILELTATHNLTEEHVEAVANVYPQLYQAVQAEITGIVGDLQSRPPYAARMMVGTLLNIPSDPSLEPEFIFRMQQNFSQTQQQDAVQNTRGGSAVSLRHSVQNNTSTRTEEVTLRL